MAKPTPHYGAWRIRWIDENGTRQSAVHDDRREALFQLHQRQLEVDERRRGLRPTPAEPKTFLDIAAYHEQHRAPQKRSFKDDLSILKQLRAGFGTLGLSNAAEWVPAIDRYVANKSHLNRCFQTVNEEDHGRSLHATPCRRRARWGETRPRDGRCTGTGTCADIGERS